MNLSKISNEELLQRMEKLVRTERKITHLILIHINEVRGRRLYADLGYSSLHEYLVKGLGYSDDSAYRRDQAARVLLQVPEVAEKLENGFLNLTQLTRVQKCLKQEKKIGEAVPLSKATEVLQLLENKNNFESQKILAVEFNQPIHIHESVRPQRDDSVRMEISLTESQMRTLKQAKDLLSHVLPEVTWAELFVHLAEKHVQAKLGKQVKVSKDSMEHSSSTQNFSVERNVAEVQRGNKRNINRERKGSGEIGESERSEGIERGERKRSSIKITTRRKLLAKAQSCCEFTDERTGKRCQSTYQLQVDHLIPLARGGTDEISNYRILCRTHNLAEAQRYGLVRPQY